MRLKINYLDNIIEFKDDMVNVIEVENKGMFYRIINDLNIYNNEEIVFFDEKCKEIKMDNKIQIIVDYFNFDFDSKINISNISKYVSEVIEEDDRVQITNLYNKIAKIYNNKLNNSDLSIQVSSTFKLEDITKLLKVVISPKELLLDNLLLLIDINKEFNNNLLVFINLKSYLLKEELEELYKYAIYNNTNILLIDSGNYGTSLKNEKKLILSNELEEYIV